MYCIVAPRAARLFWPVEPCLEERVALERFDWLQNLLRQNLLRQRDIKTAMRKRHPQPTNIPSHPSQ